MTKVMVFGTFDRLHPGHNYFLHEAKQLGDELVVIVGLDETVAAIKNHLPRQNERERLAAIEKNPAVTRARLGSREDKFARINEERPDIIALGYDQTAFVDQLVQKFGDTIRIVRLPSFSPEIYKSSKLP